MFGAGHRAAASRLSSMRHRVDDVIDADADAEGGELLGVARVVGVFPGIAEIHVVTDGDHQPAVVVVDAAPVGGAAGENILLVDLVAGEELRARDPVSYTHLT